MTMEGPHATARGSVTSSSSSTASASLKSSAMRAKLAAGVNADTRKRKRGALQDISNSSRLGVSTTAKKTANPATVIKPTKGTLASVAKGVARQGVATKPLKPTASSNPVPAKRRRQDDHPQHHSENAPHTKKQTSLLSFPSIAPPKMIKKEKQENSQAVVIKDEPEMECTETLEKAEHVELSQATMKREVFSVPPTQTDACPPYVPPPYKFQVDHRDSGFDEETYRSQVWDIDAEFKDSPVHCVKIIQDMDRFHRKHELKYHPVPDYIGSVQLDINEKMRGILVDWLVEVGEEYELDSQTFHKAVNLVDRCLATMKINRKQFQLLGCACMMIAAKFEEVYAPNVEEFVYISDQTYTPEEMLEMEIKVLHALEYRIGSTTCHGFLPRFTRAGCSNDKQKALVEYLCDLAILDYGMLSFRPSQLAASAVYLSRLMTSEVDPWTPTLHHYSKYNAWDLQPCVLALYQIHRAENDVVQTQRDKAKAVSEKYLADKFHAASAIPSIDQATVEQSFLFYQQPSRVITKRKKAVAVPAEDEANP